KVTPPPLSTNSTLPKHLNAIIYIFKKVISLAGDQAMSTSLTHRKKHTTSTPLVQKHIDWALKQQANPERRRKRMIQQIRTPN
ncbi:MAG TPA: hypothetical protein VL995_18335, partial [Cellvibrio sp.]|nr:hypothetical protein [Cellvibrio sp.]